MGGGMINEGSGELTRPSGEYLGGELGTWAGYGPSTSYIPEMAHMDKLVLSHAEVLAFAANITKGQRYANPEDYIQEARVEVHNFLAGLVPGAQVQSEAV